MNWSKSYLPLIYNLHIIIIKKGTTEHKPGMGPAISDKLIVLFEFKLILLILF